MHSSRYPSMLLALQLLMISYLLMCWHASLGSRKLWNLAVGMSCLDMNSLENSLLASIWAALALGPKQGTPSTGRSGRNTGITGNKAESSLRDCWKFQVNIITFNEILHTILSMNSKSKCSLLFIYKDEPKILNKGWTLQYCDKSWASMVL